MNDKLSLTSTYDNDIKQSATQEARTSSHTENMLSKQAQNYRPKTNINRKLDEYLLQSPSVFSSFQISLSHTIG